MAKDKVSVQDIANSLGLSRTTVSKSLNGDDKVPEKTRNLVLQRASEMKYKQFAYLQLPKEITSSVPLVKNISGNFALLAHMMPNKFHIGSALLASLEQEISRFGYTLSVHILLDRDINAVRLPINLDTDKIDSIVCVEMFDPAYSKMLCSLGKPLIFVDTFYTEASNPLDADILLMESQYAIFSMVKQIITENDLKRIGFVGDQTHCLSFYERWNGFSQALMECGLPLNESNCIMEADSKYRDIEWIQKKLLSMKLLPELFVCANDALAISLISALKKLEIRVPKDILVAGFDNIPESRVVEPHLTTVNVPSSDMGIIIANRLLNCIENKTLPHITSYVRSKVIMRESTQRI